MEELINALIWFAIAYAVARLLATWLMQWLTKEIRAEIEEFTSKLESGKLIPVTVEVDKKQYFCYNAITKDFVCQGFTITEIADNFSLRFPGSKIAIYNGDETAVKELKEQMEKLYENRGSK